MREFPAAVSVYSRRNLSSNCSEEVPFNLITVFSSHKEFPDFVHRETQLIKTEIFYRDFMNIITLLLLLLLL